MRLMLTVAAVALLTACSPSQPKADPEFGAKVRAYLLEHPELLVEMSEKLEVKQAEASRQKALAGIGANRDKLERDPRDHVLNPDGKITVVQFFDYNCGYCKLIAPQVLTMAKENPDVRFVFKDLVIFGEASEYSAAGASLAKTSEQYKAIHNAFMSTKPLNDEAVDRILKANGVDPAEARKAQSDAKRKAYIKDVHTLAETLGIQGTPAFIIGDVLIPGADGAALKAAVANAKKKAS
ncbi:DsbA family protein [Caulobacter mirabilis]|uniref:Disulfide bond formation protein DsbA n=1 Tax=Caulobacter mirabilis TaxID=69666 RepID=A0A2D2AYY8_9CAUL|nr:DsbA family protein [Caulobacter mirabilis]ATQ43194.1 disulfide bond formation protein DsbA [Caulobacter mirabilis]